ncbi:MAG: XdhC family protein [Neisseriaceae bacterium]|nr:XdhC family protein [Neisseriaceae bacterium]
MTPYQLIQKQRELAQHQGVLVTLVEIEGSSYRNIGAKMLIDDVGQAAGMISGGCLEKDVIQKAWWLTEGEAAALRTYDTSSEGNQDLNYNLGCNGIIHLLFERTHQPGCAEYLKAFNSVYFDQQPAASAVIYRSDRADFVGKRLLINQQGTLFSDDLPQALKAEINSQLHACLQQRQNHCADIHHQAGTHAVFFEAMRPPVALTIFGAGQDAQPLAHFAKQLGWLTTVVDMRPDHAHTRRFPQVDRVMNNTFETPLTDSPPADDAVIVVMSHSLPQDQAVLAALLTPGTHFRYLGILGPASRTHKILDAIGPEAWQEAERHQQQLSFPIGLNIGADSPDEVALSILAEIKAVLTTSCGGRLKHRTARIHQRMAKKIVSVADVSAQTRDGTKAQHDGTAPSPRRAKIT